MKSLFHLLLFTFFGFSLLAQTAEQKAIIATYEGFPPMPFEAPDLNKQTHFLPDYKDQVVLLSFWNTETAACLQQIPVLNNLYQTYHDQGLVIIGFADETTDQLQTFLQAQSIDYPVIPNSKGLGEMAFAGELGYPRLFLIDKFGVIKRVFTQVENEASLQAAILPLLK